jgi:hypothetical protein
MRVTVNFKLVGNRQSNEFFIYESLQITSYMQRKEGEKGNYETILQIKPKILYLTFCFQLHVTYKNT